MRPEKSWRLRNLLALLAAIALLPIALVGAWSIKSSVERQRDEIEKSALEISRALATAVNADLEVTISALKTLTRSPTLAADDIGAFYSVANNVLPSQPHWRSIILTDGSGSILFKTGSAYGSMTTKIADPDSLQRAINSGTPVVGGIAKGPLAMDAYAVRVPVIRDGELKYVLTAAVLPDRVSDIVNQQKAPEDWIIAVFDSSGRKVARTKNHQSVSASPSLMKLLADGRPEGIGITRTLEDVESLTAYTRIADHGWVVAIAIPSSRLESTLLHSVLLWVAGILLSVIAYIVVAGYIARSIVSGMNDLHSQAIRLVKGDAGRSPSRSRIREFDEMSEALDTLSAERAEIEASRKELLTSLNTALDSARHALSQAEDAAKAKDIFLAMLGHELRNPLAPIVAALDLMEFKGDAATAYEREVMRRQVDHMRRLVDDLLDASRIIQGKLSIAKAPTNIMDVVRHALDAVQDLAKQAGASIHVGQTGKELWVEGDAARLIQVFTNLLTNALKFAPSGKIDLRIFEHENRVSIEVADDGVGIAPETIDDIFHPFFQAPQTIARTEGGLGLGLAIVRTIVELHGGTVHASSAGLGKGTQFEVCLPLIAKPAAPDLGTPVSSGKPAKKIMVVDDNADAIDLLASGLRLAGHEVGTTTDAKTALDLFGKLAPEIVILDLGMPDIDGYTLAGMIRLHYPEWNGLLVALSGYGQAQDKEKAAGAGFEVHLTKPVGIQELERVIFAGSTAVS